MTQMQLTMAEEGGPTGELRVTESALEPVRLAVGAVRSVLAGEDFGVFAGSSDQLLASLCALALGMMVRSHLDDAGLTQLRRYLLDENVAHSRAIGMDRVSHRSAEVWHAYRAFVEETFRGACRTGTPERVARRLKPFSARIRLRAASYAVAIFAGGEMTVYGEEIDDFEFFWATNRNPADRLGRHMIGQAS